MIQRRPDLHDIEVGRRIRARRIARQMSQMNLGEQLGITFQQVQKYEKGVNRVGAGRLKRIADILDAPITYFFAVPEQPPAPEAELGQLLGFAENARTLRLVRAYSQIQNPQVQHALLDLTERIAATN